MFFLLRNFQPIEGRSNSVKGIKQQSALEGHPFSVPMPVWHIKGDYATRARFDASSIGSKIDCHMIYFARDKPTHETPKLAGQNIRLAVHRTDNIARLDRNSFDLICVNHFRSVHIIRKTPEIVSWNLVRQSSIYQKIYLVCDIHQLAALNLLTSCCKPVIKFACVQLRMGF